MPTTFMARYPGELTDEDHAALQGAGLRVYKDAVGLSAAWRVGDDPPDSMTTYQYVRVRAESPDDVRQQIVDALGREPDGLHIVDSSSG